MSVSEKEIRLRHPWAADAATDIVLGRGVLEDLSGHLEPHRGARLVLVSDAHVAPLHAEPLRRRLVRAGWAVHLLEMPAGEQAKTFETLTRLYHECQALALERDDVVVAVGGGLVGDVAGMLAATYMRGLPLVQVPTTLVAMVTASVGGKVGVNFGGGKNLIGTFKHPEWVIADLATLDTLPERELRSGLGELVTVGVLGAPEIFEAMEDGRASDLSPWIAAALACKSRIVEADPEDRLGIRAHLNLGHTFGHAYEALSGFELAHGLAVAVGLHTASRLAAALGICDATLPERVRATLKRSRLPTGLRGFRAERVVEAMRQDKKRRGGRLRWVLPEDVGRVTLVNEDQVPAALLTDVLRRTVEVER